MGRIVSQRGGMVLGVGGTGNKPAGVRKEVNGEGRRMAGMQGKVDETGTPTGRMGRPPIVG
jgi:hypothetical protein